MNWGKWIIVVFIVFAAFIGTLVTVCVRQDISLVSNDYYRDELAFEQQMARVRNGNELSVRPALKVLADGTIEVAFDNFGEMEKGELKLFRPSDATLDKTYALIATSSPIQIFSTGELEPGMYRAKMQWTMNGKEFFMEEVILL